MLGRKYFGFTSEISWICTEVAQIMSKYEVKDQSQKGAKYGLLKPPLLVGLIMKRKRVSWFKLSPSWKSQEYANIQPKNVSALILLVEPHKELQDRP